MNFYEHHIRDYDAATSHLSWDEDLAYTRLLRWYYRKERAIPADVAEACRQVRATTKQQRDAVTSVLGEFFELHEDGWHQSTCDQAIAAYLDGEPDRNQKKVNEDTRLKRHRGERRSLFAQLNAAGGHASWNTQINELRDMVSRICVPAATPTATQPATAPATPATATHGNASPVPTTQFPLPNKIIPSEADASAAGAAHEPLSAKELVWSLGPALLSSQRDEGRPFLGKLVSTYGEAVVAAALEGAAREQPGEPKGWLTKACAAVKPQTRRANGSHAHTSSESKNYREGVADDGTLIT